jgi:hypothetical protein
MTSTDFEKFLSESVNQERDAESGLDADELYGLYTSWCLLNNVQPETPDALWAALKGRHISPGNNHLTMKGPVAADYIIASAPDLTD